METKSKLNFLPLLLVIVLFSIFNLSCQSELEYRKIDLSNLVPVNTAPLESSDVVLRVAFSAVLSPIETMKTYSQLVSYLGQALGRPVEMIQRNTYAEINYLVQSQYVDIAFVCSLAYVMGNDDLDMELLVVPEVGGETVYYSYLIVPMDSTVESLADLRDKTFAFTDPLSNSGRLAPTYQLYQIGETPDDFFAKYIFTYSHDNSIRAVAEGLVDGGAVDSLVYDYVVGNEPEIGLRTRIIEKSPPFGIPPVIAHPSLDQEIKARLRSLFLNMNQDEAGRTILDGLHIERFVIGDDASYGMIRSMANEVGW
ncbi:phosphate/phosphite/phosphonate ABC transporter substrate-binding protein [Chloroflexota bacterium]